MPSFRSSTTAGLRQRIVSGENVGVNGIPFAALKRLTVTEDTEVTRRRLDRHARGSEPGG
jgi:hypothetical protein